MEGRMNHLREIRTSKRITQFQLRLVIGIHQSKISLIENGLVQPSEDEKKKIAKALGVGVEDIWKRD
jgi:DNA-binding XRE family transcriptional regulator